MNEKQKPTKMKRFLDITGLIVCIILLPIVIVNMTMFIQTLIHPNYPPNFFGYTPLIISSGSMSPTMEAGDMLVVKQVENASNLEEGTIITYLYGDVLISHRIASVEKELDGTVKYITQGDANNAPDTTWVSPSQIVGVYHKSFSKLGNFALFVQSPVGILVVVVIPLVVLFASFMILDHFHYKKLRKELEEIQRSNQIQTDNQ